MVDTEHLRSYYNLGGYEAIDFIEGQDMTFNEGNVFKYLYRCNTFNPKGEVKEDLKKALYYAKRALMRQSSVIYTRNKHGAMYYINMLNTEAFSENIYFALISLIEATSTSMIYDDRMSSVIQFITNELNETD